eukprot:432829-Amphidinium_carterae.1
MSDAHKAARHASQGNEGVSAPIPHEPAHKTTPSVLQDISLQVLDTSSAAHPVAKCGKPAQSDGTSLQPVT